MQQMPKAHKDKLTVHASTWQQALMLACRCKQAEILAGVCGQREALERRVYEQDVQLELNLDELETAVQVSIEPT